MTTRVLDQIPAGTFCAGYQDNRPDWLQEKGIEVRTTNFPQYVLESVFREWAWPSALLRVPYTALPPDYHPLALELPFFVGFQDHEDQRHYFVSADPSRQYADLWVLHEAIEFEMYSSLAPDPLMDLRAPYCPCQQALLDELAVAELIGIDMKAYVMHRYEFFTRLVAFHEKHQLVSEDQLRDMKKSLDAIHEEFRMLDLENDH